MNEQFTADGKVMPPMPFVPRIELTDENRGIDTEVVRDAMILEYNAYAHLHGLDLSSADEHLFDETLTLDQLVWVREFTQRWEHNDQLEDLKRQEAPRP